MTMRLLLAQIRADCQGASFVELGIIAPFFALLALGTVDASRAVIEKMAVQQAASRTIEMAAAGGLNSDAFGNLQSEAATAAGVSTSNVTVDAWLECDRVRQSDFNGDCPSNQEIGRYVSVLINKNYSPWFASSLAGLGYNVSRAITVKGKASVRMQ